MVNYLLDMPTNHSKVTRKRMEQVIINREGFRIIYSVTYVDENGELHQNEMEQEVLSLDLFLYQKAQLLLNHISDYIISREMRKENEEKIEKLR